MEIKKHLNLLGLTVIDRVTNFSGIATSVTFDLYGCVQALVNPGIDAQGKPQEQCWFDVNRLLVTDAVPVMARPNFDFGPVAEGKQGAAEKPKANKA